MKTDLEQRASEGRLRLTGELNIYSAGELKESLLAELNRNSTLEVDISEVAGVDGAGLQILALAARESRQTGKRLRLTGDCPALVRLLDLLALRGYFGEVLDGRLAQPQGGGA